MRAFTKIFLSLLMLFTMAAMVYSESTTTSNTESVPTTAATTSTAANSTIQSPPMTLVVDNSLPDKFRGGNPDTGLIHVLEDEKYKRQEHSILYEEEPTSLEGAQNDAKYTGAPTIDWTTEKVNDDGSLVTLSNENTNCATNENMFPEPGEYRVSNSGARQVSGTTTEGSEGTTEGSNQGTTSETSEGEENGGANGTTPITSEGTENGAANATTPTTGAGSENAAANGTTPTTEGGTENAAAATTTPTTAEQRVTANQTIGVECHDCTAPNLYAIVQEGAGSNKLAVSEQDLVNQLRDQIANDSFNPEAQLDGGLKEANLIAVFEPADKKNARPKDKVAKIALKGMIFDDSGKKTTEAVEVPMKILSQDDQTRIAHIGAESVKGVYVRRSIPFLAAVQMTDNYKFNPDGAKCYIRNKTTGADVEKIDGSYLFRIPNYPRDEYKDQPDLELVINAKDSAGNQTLVQLPLYVVNTQTSFEGSRNE